MSDTMLIGVLRMPVDDHGDLELMQFIARARQAADRIEQGAEKIAQAHAAKTKAEEAELAAAQELDEVRSERDALAARLEELLEVIRDDVHGIGVDMRRVEAIINQAPTTSLTRLKAKWQAEALEKAAEEAPSGLGAHAWKYLRHEAAKLRRQAEEPTE